MKTVEFKTVPMTVFGEKQELEYKPLIQVIVEQPVNPQTGATIDEVRRSVRVLDKLEASNGKMELEDSDFEYLYNRIKNAHFTSNNKAFVDFVDYFDELANVKKTA